MGIIGTGIVPGSSDGIAGVKCNWTSLIPDENGVVRIPYATNHPENGYGVVRTTDGNGGIASYQGQIYIAKATDLAIINREGQFGGGFGGITPKNIDYAVKRAMTDGVGTAWTDAEKNGCYDRINIRKSALDNVLVPNGYYDLGSTDQASLTLTLPTPSGTDNFSCNEIYIAFKSGSTATTLSIVGTYEGDTSYLPSANCICEMSFKYICGTWVLITKETEISI